MVSMTYYLRASMGRRGWWDELHPLLLQLVSRLQLVFILSPSLHYTFCITFTLSYQLIWLICCKDPDILPEIQLTPC